MISVNQVSKRYGTKTALQDVSIDLPPGGITGLVGENGSGKSTLLKTLAGLVRPSRGSVQIDGTRVTRRIASKVAYLSELDAYYSFYTVGDMVNFQASQFRDFNREKAQEMLAFMNLDPSVKLKTLSKGNRGRVKIVLTLSRDAPVILMDEPLSGLDPMVRESIVKSLISFIDVDKQTVIITTHEIKEMEALFDRVIAIKGGRILDVADTEDIRDRQGLSVVEWMTQHYSLPS
ncbi:ABC-2 type transport system ATP-binding protein [Alteribacillus persepolensis]|uniref:ABC-2 type transport system ATP-binding protein n=1 Tax=Alteribacillus persepolensis TaxID=568899 RepID=A0A1G8EX82_9BACI|nr:ABC transporter ATP-binding protein [Alteribacillus persepolensis]SDH74513.1 ABC-2 type transport system ATP-binding protein [Alteribacillus persepolensis]